MKPIKEAIIELLPEKKDRAGYLPSMDIGNVQQGALGAYNFALTASANKLCEAVASEDDIKIEIFQSKGYSKIANSSQYPWIDEIKLIVDALRSEYIILRRIK